MGFHRENTNTTTVGYGRRERLPLTTEQLPHSKPTITAGYAGKGEENDVEAQKNEVSKKEY